MRKLILPLFILVAAATASHAQAYDQQATIQKTEEMLNMYKRKMDALLVEIGTMAFEAPDYMKDSVDVVSWLRDNKPGVYRSNREFLESFAKDYLGIESKEQAPRGILDWYYDMWDRIQVWAEKTAGRLIGVWRAN